MKKNYSKIVLGILLSIVFIIFFSLTGERIYGFLTELMIGSVISNWIVLFISFLFALACSVLSVFEIKKLVSAERKDVDNFFMLFLLTIFFLIFFSIFRLSIKILI